MEIRVRCPKCDEWVPLANEAIDLHFLLPELTARCEGTYDMPGGLGTNDRVLYTLGELLGNDALLHFNAIHSYPNPDTLLLSVDSEGDGEIKFQVMLPKQVTYEVIIARRQAYEMLENVGHAGWEIWETIHKGAWTKKKANVNKEANRKTPGPTWAEFRDSQQGGDS